MFDWDRYICQAKLMAGRIFRCPQCGELHYSRAELLRAENLVHSRRGPQGGTLVKRPSNEEVSASLANAMRLLAGLGEFKFEDIFEARCELEVTCCRLAASRFTETHRDSMLAEIASHH